MKDFLILMQTLAGRFHVDIERPENDTSQGFSEVRHFGFGNKVYVTSWSSNGLSIMIQDCKNK